MRIIFKNQHTGDTVIKKGKKYHFMRDQEILKETIRNSVVDLGQDWEMIEPSRDLYIKGKNCRGKDFFKSFIKGIEYHQGDVITIQKNMRFGDGKRDFTIKNFYIGDKPDEDGAYEFVYVQTTCGRDIHLSDVIVK